MNQHEQNKAAIAAARAKAGSNTGNFKERLGIVPSQYARELTAISVIASTNPTMSNWDIAGEATKLLQLEDAAMEATAKALEPQAKIDAEADAKADEIVGDVPVVDTPIE